MTAFKVFPVNAQKEPLIKSWQSEATTDPEKIALWQNLFRSQLAYWGVPTGPANDLLVLDIDVKGNVNGFETLKTLPIPQTTSQRTRSGGAHYLFRYPKDGRQYGNRAGFKPGLDVRGAGGYIVYYGTDNTPLAEPPAWLLENTVKPVAQATGPSIQVAPTIAEGIIAASLDAIRNAAEGESNNTLNVESFKLGQLVASGAITRDYAEAALFRAAKERGKPDYEARATITSGLNGGVTKPIVSPFGSEPPVALIQMPGTEPQARWTPSYFTKHDLMNTSKLRKPQLFEDWSTEDITIVTADGGTGKTTLMLQEAIALALGERFLGFECKQPGKTLFITGEDTDKKLAAMLGAIMRQMGLFEEGIDNDDKVHTILRSIVIKKDVDLCLIVKDRAGFISPNQDAIRKVSEAIEDIKPKMIVFDPISSFWGSESMLNDMNRAVIKCMNAFVEHGICVVMINHVGKISSANQDMSQFAGRGGTGLPSNARVSRALRSVNEEEYNKLTGEHLEGKQTAMMCNVNKFTDGSPLFNKPFLIVRDGYLFIRKTLSKAKELEVEKQMSDVEKVFTFVKEERRCNRYPTTDVVIGHFITCGDPIPQTRVKTALKMLAYQGHMGEKLKMVENPDVTVKDRVYVVTDLDGKES